MLNDVLPVMSSGLFFIPCQEKKQKAIKQGGLNIMKAVQASWHLSQQSWRGFEDLHLKPGQSFHVLPGLQPPGKAEETGAKPRDFFGTQPR